MPQTMGRSTSGEGGKNPPPSRAVSRREFLRVAGAAGIATAGAGFAALAAGCGGPTGTTATTAPPVGNTGATGPAAPMTADTVATTETPPTSSQAGVEKGAGFKAGYVVPLTGRMADLGTAIAWQVDWFSENVWKDGLLMGDGKRHPFTVVLKDMRSDSGRASQVAQGLLTDEKVGLIGGSGGAAVVLPVREVAEGFECPCVTLDCPGDAWNADQPEGGYDWCWHTWFVLRDMAMNFLAVWDALPTNKRVGGLYPNSGDGLAFADALPLLFELGGYTYVDPGRFEDGTKDYTAIIGQLHKQGVEIVNGVPLAEDYARFWEQAVRQGFHPKVSTQAKALLFPAALEALGDRAAGHTLECWFHPAFPYTSGVTGLTAQQLCGLWEEDQGVQWTQALCFFSLLELWTDILTRCKNPADKTEIVSAIRETKTTTIGGPVDWTVNPEPYSGFYNFSTKPIAAGQWVKGSGPWRYDLQVVASATHTEITPTAAAGELSYPS